MNYCILFWACFTTVAASSTKSAQLHNVLTVRQYPKQPTGQFPNSYTVNRCQNSREEDVPCPKHTVEDNAAMERFMETCLTEDKEEDSAHDGFICRFFPVSADNEQSCHHMKTPKYPCAYGFKIKPARHFRKVNADDVLISVEFFGKLLPPPVQGNGTGIYDIGHWIAFGISLDKVMGDDLIIYCHPYMDRNQFPWGMEGDHPPYPESIGVGINKYYTTGNGKQAYDVKRNFDKFYGTVRRVGVKWQQWDKEGWGVINCKADISTYVLFNSKTELGTGIELDMEKQRKAFIFMASGHCLHPKCLGDHPNNSLAEIARLTTPMSKHNNLWMVSSEMTLFKSVKKGGQWRIDGNWKVIVIAFIADLFLANDL